MVVQHIGIVPLRSVLSVFFTQKSNDSAEILYFFVEPPMQNSDDNLISTADLTPIQCRFKNSF